MVLPGTGSAETKKDRTNAKEAGQWTRLFCVMCAGTFRLHQSSSLRFGRRVQGSVRVPICQTFQHQLAVEKEPFFGHGRGGCLPGHIEQVGEVAIILVGLACG